MNENIGEEIIKIIDNLPININSVIVYDIDGTLIDFSGEPIIPIINTYCYSLCKGLIPIIITARIGTPENINRTIAQLEMFGISNYRHVYFLPHDRTDVPRFKYYARKNISDRGYCTLMSIGDNVWDIGEYGGIGIKL